MLHFREVELSDAEQIFAWRSAPRIDEMMATTFTADMAEHIAWMKRACSSPDYYHWIVCDDDRDIGLISLARFNLVAGSTSWGYYLADVSNPSIGGRVPAYLYNFVFDRFTEINVITAQVLERNSRVARLHEVYGYERQPKLDSEIMKNGRAERLLALKLTRERWEEQEKYHGLRAEFPTLHWDVRK